MLQFSKPVYQLLQEQYIKLNGFFMYRITIYHRHDTTRLQVNQRQVRDRFQNFGMVYVLLQRQINSDMSHNNGGFKDLTKYFIKAMVTSPRE